MKMACKYHKIEKRVEHIAHSKQNIEAVLVVETLVGRFRIIAPHPH